MPAALPTLALLQTLVGRRSTVWTNSAAMQIGYLISGAGHVGLIGWVVLGGLLRPAPPPLEVQQVSVISSAAFDALTATAPPAPDVTPVVQPAPPVEETAPQTQTNTDVARPAPDAPDALDVPQSENVPQVPTPPQRPAPVEDLAPELALPAPDVPPAGPETPERAETPVPRPSDRVAPQAVAAPDPEAAPDLERREAVTAAEDGDSPAEPQEATAPEEAATEIVTEAEEPAAVATAAPLGSVRPPSRRPQPPQQTAEAAEPAPNETSASAEETAQDAPEEDPLAAALAEALAASDAPTAPDAPRGPPLSAGEQEALRVAVSTCWNVGSLSSEALRTTVVVGVSMLQNAKPIQGSIRLISSEGGSSTAARQAFEAARRAIIRCGARGFNLPVEKYDHWKDIEMTFNPERMRIK